MCLEITYSVIAKYPEIFFNALKTDQNKKSYIFSRHWDPRNPCVTI